MTYDVRIGFSLQHEEAGFNPEFAANIIAAKVREALDAAAFEKIERGIGVRVTPRGAQVHADYPASV
jgi:hypothetical protein